MFLGKLFIFFLNGVIKGDFLKEIDWRVLSVIINFYNKVFVDRNVIFYVMYDLLVYGVKSFFLLLNLNKLFLVFKEYSVVENWR